VERSAATSRTPTPRPKSPDVLVALDASIVVIGPGGERSLAADGFFTGS